VVLLDELFRKGHSYARAGDTVRIEEVVGSHFLRVQVGGECLFIRANEVTALPPGAVAPEPVEGQPPSVADAWAEETIPLNTFPAPMSYEPPPAIEKPDFWEVLEPERESIFDSLRLREAAAGFVVLAGLFILYQAIRFAWPWLDHALAGWIGGGR
jgi:hypothetical protein